MAIRLGEFTTPNELSVLVAIGTTAVGGCGIEAVGGCGGASAGQAAVDDLVAVLGPLLTYPK